jgi:hypothetical protein
MDEHHVRTRSRTLSSVAQTLLAKGQCIVFGSMAGAATSEDDRHAFGHGRTALGLGPGAQEIAPFDQRGSEHGAMVEPRAGDRLPGRTELVEVEGCCDLAHLFQRQHGAFGALRPLDLGFEFMGVDFGSIGGGNKRADLVGRPVEGVDLRSRSGERC